MNGWGSWIRTNEMADSESAALPLGDTPMRFSIILLFVRNRNRFLIYCLESVE